MGAIIGTHHAEDAASHAKESFSPVVPGFTANTSQRSQSSLSSEFSLTEGQLKRDAIADSELECSQITKYLFIAGRRVAENLELLLEKKITRIINCASSVVPNYHQGFGNMKYLSMNLVDGNKEDISWFVCEVIQFIYEGAQKKERVLLHCEKGISRSCAFGIAYRMWSTGETYRAAFNFISARRTVCDPKPAFICNLTEIGEIFFGSQVETSLLFRCSYHAAYDPTTPVLKVCRNLQKSSREVIVPATSLLNPKGVFLLRTVRSNRHFLFLWKGRNATATTRQQAFHLASFMARIFSNASTITVIEEGNETEDFLSFLLQDGPFKSREDACWEDYFDYPPTAQQIEAATSADASLHSVSRGVSGGNSNNNLIGGNNNDDGNTPKNSTTPRGSFRVKPVVYGQVNVQGKPLSRSNSFRSVSKDNNETAMVVVSNNNQPVVPSINAKELTDRISSLISGENSLRMKVVASVSPSPIPLPAEELVITNNNNNNVVPKAMMMINNNDKEEEVRISSSAASTVVNYSPITTTTTEVAVVVSDQRKEMIGSSSNLSSLSTPSNAAQKKTEVKALALSVLQASSPPKQSQPQEVPPLKAVAPPPQRNFNLALPLQQPQQQTTVVPQFQLPLNQLEQQTLSARGGGSGGRTTSDQLKLPPILNRNGSSEKLPNNSNLQMLHTPNKNNMIQNGQGFYAEHESATAEQQHSYSRTSSNNRLEPVSSASDLLKQSTTGGLVPLIPSRPASAERRSFSYGVSPRVNVGNITSGSNTSFSFKNTTANAVVIEGNSPSKQPSIPSLSLLSASISPPMKENVPNNIVKTNTTNSAPVLNLNSGRPPSLKRDEFRDIPLVKTPATTERNFAKPFLYQLSRKSDEEDSDQAVVITSAEHYEWMSLFDYEYDDLQNVNASSANYFVFFLLFTL
jgi:protein-tyrosine phosphatase/PHD/YefM family antitoxin component YafN of YafNO toxin-antitoxin module